MKETYLTIAGRIRQDLVQIENDRSFHRNGRFYRDKRGDYSNSVTAVMPQRSGKSEVSFSTTVTV